MGKTKNKTCRINLRLSPEEREALDAITKYRGIGISTFLTNAIKEEDERVKKEREDLERRRYLQSIGIDI